MDDTLHYDTLVSDITNEIKIWEEIDLSHRLRDEFDSASVVIGERQEAGRESRRRLIEQVRAFKMAPDTAKLDNFGTILKLFQSEVDQLTKRAKLSEGNFLSIYRLTYDAPDPLILLRNIKHKILNLRRTEEEPEPKTSSRIPTPALFELQERDEIIAELKQKEVKYKDFISRYEAKIVRLTDALESTDREVEALMATNEQLKLRQESVSTPRGNVFPHESVDADLMLEISQLKSMLARKDAELSELKRNLVSEISRQKLLEIEHEKTEAVNDLLKVKEENEAEIKDLKAQNEVLEKRIVEIVGNQVRAVTCNDLDAAGSEVERQLILKAKKLENELTKTRNLLAKKEQDVKEQTQLSETMSKRLTSLQTKFDEVLKGSPEQLDSGLVDGLRGKIRMLESAINRSDTEKERALMKYERIQKENLNLFKQVKYLDQFKERDLEGQRDLRNKYEKIYSEEIDPFLRFQREELQGASRGASRIDKITLGGMKVVVNSPLFRKGVLIYSLCVHVMLFFVIYYWMTSTS